MTKEEGTYTPPSIDPIYIPEIPEPTIPSPFCILPKGYFSVRSAAQKPPQSPVKPTYYEKFWPVFRSSSGFVRRIDP